MSGLKICPQCGAEYDLDQRFCPKDGTTLRLQNATGDLVGSIIADRYHVLRKLGEGGMGQVYLAEHVKMGRKSAVKVMNPAMVKDADAISRFNREASNASKINNPHVADIYDFGETPEGMIYLAMEFVDGPSLTKLIEDQGAATLPTARTAAIVRQTAEALAAAHDMGIVHRDLKPDNIMIARERDGSDCVKVVDFGIAKAADNAAQKVTKTGLVVGTPEYMSPEQLAGDKLDGRSDIYALGLVAFAMLTGRLPFPAETVQESMIMRLTEPPKKLSEMRPEVGWTREVQAVLDRALERDAAARYTNAGDFGRDFARALEQMVGPRVATTQAMEPVPQTKVRELVAPVSRKRNTRLVAGAGAVTLVAALVVGALVMMNGDASAGRSVVTPAGNTASQSGASAGDSALTARQLDSLDNIVRGSTVSRDAAEKVLNELGRLQGNLRSDDQIVKAAMVRALALSSRKDSLAACRTLHEVEALATKTRFKNQVSVAIGIACNQ